MNKKKEVFPQLRFGRYKSKWIIDSFDFEFLQTNSFSRAEMDDEKGNVKNIHYGDILTKYNDVLRDISVVPFVNKNVDLSKFREESYLKNGDIVIADTAEDFTAGKAVEVLNVDFPVLAGQHTFLCRPKIKFAPGFMGYYLNSPSYHNRLIPLLTGTKVYSISKANIKSTFVLHPENYEEQQKIADCLSSIDELIDAESRKLKALEKYKKGLMQKLFPAEGKTLPEWRFPEFQGCGEWKYEEIGNIGKVITGKTPSTSDAALWDGDIQFVTPTDITENKYQHHTQRTVVKTPKIKVLPKHTIMFTCIASIGKMALSLYPCITNQQINSIVPKSCYNNEFIYYSLLQKTFLIKAGFVNSTLPIINKTDFSKIQVPVILDKKEQQKIAECLSEADTMIEEQSNKVEQLKAHKKGLMQGLFPSLEEADV